MIFLILKIKEKRFYYFYFYHFEVKKNRLIFYFRKFFRKRG